MKTLYLHIGLPKTATTSIQNFCNDNHEILEKNGFCYPLFYHKYRSVAIVRNAHFLFGRVYRNEQDRFPEQEKKYYKKGMEQVYSLFDEYDNIILSDESVWNCSFRSDEPESLWMRIKQEVDKGIFQLKVIVYLRRQDELAVSWWKQQVQDGYRPEAKYSWEKMEQAYRKDKTFMKLHYDQMLEAIAQYVGKECLIVRRFGRDYFEGGSIYSDFLSILGLELTEEYEITNEVLNLSISNDSAEIKRILNGIPELIRKEKHILRRSIDSLAERGVKDKTGVLSKEEAEKFLDLYEEGNRKIAKEYFGEEELFHRSFKDTKKWSMQNPEFMEETIRFEGMSILHLMETIEALEARIDELERKYRHLEDAVKNLYNSFKHPMKTISRKLGGK